MRTYTRTRIEPRTASPTVRRLFEIIDAQRIDYAELAGDIGAHLASLHGWKSGSHTPGILQVEALAKAIGRRVEVVA